MRIVKWGTAMKLNIVLVKNVGVMVFFVSTGAYGMNNEKAQPEQSALSAAQTLPSFALPRPVFPAVVPPRVINPKHVAIKKVFKTIKRHRGIVNQTPALRSYARLICKEAVYNGLQKIACELDKMLSVQPMQHDSLHNPHVQRRLNFSDDNDNGSTAA